MVVLILAAGAQLELYRMFGAAGIEADRSAGLALGALVVLAFGVQDANDGRAIFGWVVWFGLAPWMLYVIVRAATREGLRDAGLARARPTERAPASSSPADDLGS